MPVNRASRLSWVMLFVLPSQNILLETVVLIVEQWVFYEPMQLELLQTFVQGSSTEIEYFLRMNYTV
jgi:hypothetical protein